MTAAAMPDHDERAAVPPATLGEAARLWAKIGFLSFGGAAAQIAMLHRLVVEERRWLDEQRFLHALNFCMLLPGPEAQQLATYVGWLLHGTRGGLVAGLLFVLPGALVMLGLSLVYAYAGHIPFVAALFLGLKAAVLAIVVDAVIRIGRRALKTRLAVALAIVAFTATILLGLPFPAIVVGAGLLGAVVVRNWPGALGAAPSSGKAPGSAVSPPWMATLRVVVLWLAVWFAPVAAAAAVLGPGHVLVDVGLFFAKLAALTFGGAYALLAWLAQAAVETKGWLSPAQMVDGLGLAETTPGPTILVTQFVGFLAGLRAPGPLNPAVSAVLAAAMTTWVTFAPSFLWIFAGAPYIERLRHNQALGGALAAISAAVVGVIAYVAVWFGLHVLFADVGEAAAGPFRIPTVDPSSVRLDSAGLCALAVLMLLVLRRGLFETLGVVTAAGLVVSLLSS
jgi:chromate transporter